MSGEVCSRNGRVSAEGSGCSVKNVFKFAGAFIAWVIGSGFATGQEILQFFTSFGYYSYGVVIINLIGFLFFGQIMLERGYENRLDDNYNHFVYFCGNKLGKFYTGLIMVTLFLIMAVLVSGAGATLFEYYRINKYIGSAIMSLMVMVAFLIGFDKLVKLVSAIGPMIIIFTLMVGVITITKDFGNFDAVPDYTKVLEETKSSPHWILSGVLYLSLNFISGSTYYSALGHSAASRKDAKYGAILGAVTLVISICIMNTAILLNAGDAAGLAIPTLFLAKKISMGFGAVFSIILILGIFSSCSTMMWTVCDRLSRVIPIKQKVLALIVCVTTYVLGMLPFSRLVNIFYPFVGYLGLVFLGCVIVKVCKGKRLKSQQHID